MASRLRRRTTALLDRLREARNAAVAWELRCSRLEADAKAAAEAQGRELERLESQLRRAKRRAAKDAEAAADRLAALQSEGQVRHKAAASALRESEAAIGGAVLQERQRVTAYWRTRMGSYGEREERVRSLLAFAGAEVEGIAASLGSRGPSQLDEDRTVRPMRSATSTSHAWTLTCGPCTREQPPF
jgi:DNA repair exonuclease SbcCD ATPase subunit